MVATSISNQRIENWWSHSKRLFTSWVIDYFKEMVSEGILIPGNHLHMECVWFVFAKFLQTQLNEVKYEWNTHYIRRSRHDTIPGIPDVLYHLPALLGHENEKVIITPEQLHNLLNERNIILEATEVMSNNDEDLEQFFNYITQTEDFTYPPKNWQEARVIYETIINRCN